MGRNAYTSCDEKDCKRSPVNGHPLYRVNPKGQTGIFMCREHAEKVEKEARRI